VTNVISVRNIEDAAARGERRLSVPKGSVITPAARDRAKDLKVELRLAENDAQPLRSKRVADPSTPPQDDSAQQRRGNGTIQGRIVGTTEIRAAIAAGLRRVAVAPGAWVTRAARHLAEEAGVTIVAEAATDGLLVNPLEDGGAITRSGPGVVRGGGLPIGGEHSSGTLPPVPLPKASNGATPRTPDFGVDPVTLDLVEHALKNIRDEMDAVLFRTAMSPGIREQHDAFPLVADPHGKMIVGQFGSFIPGFLQGYSGTVEDGDVFLLNDPYSCDGAISHLNDWLVLLPIYYSGSLTGWASMFGHMSDVGGSVPGSMPVGARSIHAEGVIIRPVKLFEQGHLNAVALDQVLAQVRLPEWNRSDLMGLVAACRLAARRVGELCDRFGHDTYLASCEALLNRTRWAVGQLIQRHVPTQPALEFEDYVDDDGLGNGPFKLKCSIWREGERAIIDWTGTDPQSPAAINFLLNAEMLKMFVGVYFIMVLDPNILFNDGYYDLIEVRIPEGSLLRPRYPAALSGRTHALGRVFDVFGAALGQSTPELMTAAGFSDSPHFFYSGIDRHGTWFQLYQIGFGGVPGRPAGDGLDGHSLWPEFTNVPNEYLEQYYPLRIERYAVLPDSGGAGRHRGGNGMHVEYHFLAPGEIAIHDDRWLTRPWGVLGGRPAQRSRKLLQRAVDQQTRPLASKADGIQVVAGDRLHFITWGGGGWGDPLERDPSAVALDVRRGLVSRDAALGDYGVVLDRDGVVQTAATSQRRLELRRRRPRQAGLFDFGPPFEEVLARCEEETGLKRPERPRAAETATPREDARHMRGDTPP
jgi:N-methylhydantoinase B